MVRRDEIRPAEQAVEFPDATDVELVFIGQIRTSLRLTGAAGGHRAPQGTNGVDNALVHDHRQLRQGLWGR
jgi:hypothetical protein